MKHNINFELKKYFIPSELPGNLKKNIKLNRDLEKSLNL